MVHPGAFVPGTDEDFNIIFDGLMALQLSALLSRKPTPSVVLCSRKLGSLIDTLPRKSHVICTIDPVYGSVPVMFTSPFKLVNRQLKTQQLPKIEW